VRIYAAMTASTYIQFANLVEVLSTIIFDDQEDINLRWNAITSIEEMGDTEQSRRIMEKALQLTAGRQAGGNAYPRFCALPDSRASASV
jgi:hypothetical protein